MNCRTDVCRDIRRCRGWFPRWHIGLNRRGRGGIFSNSILLDQHVGALVENLTPSILKLNLACQEVTDEHLHTLVCECNKIIWFWPHEVVGLSSVSIEYLCNFFQHFMHFSSCRGDSKMPTLPLLRAQFLCSFGQSTLSITAQNSVVSASGSSQLHRESSIRFSEVLIAVSFVVWDTYNGLESKDL